ncbi:hypothetical protein [Flavobacterium rivuli]|nr:hypothetical protein [Flavobacterium rivuli]
MIKNTGTAVPFRMKRSGIEESQIRFLLRRNGKTDAETHLMRLQKWVMKEKNKKDKNERIN